jgi:hypothetical protein
MSQVVLQGVPKPVPNVPELSHTCPELSKMDTGKEWQPLRSKLLILQPIGLPELTLTLSQTVPKPVPGTDTPTTLVESESTKPCVFSTHCGTLARHVNTDTSRALFASKHSGQPPGRPWNH